MVTRIACVPHALSLPLARIFPILIIRLGLFIFLASYISRI